MNTTLPAASWDASAEALLVEGAGLRVHSVFERALNLANAHGELVGLVGPAVGNGPATVVLVALPEPGLGRLGLVPGCAAEVSGGRLRIGERLSVDLRSARRWVPVQAYLAVSRGEALARVGEGERIAARVNPPKLGGVGGADPAGGLRPLLPHLEALAGSSGQGVESPPLDPVCTTAWRALGALAHTWRHEDSAGMRQAASRLTGLGPGLTPSGDDLLAGLLVAASRTCPAAATRLAASCVAASVGQTTDLGVARVRHAAAGAIEEVQEDVLANLLGEDGGQLESTVTRAARWGHTSGLDTLVGVFFGLRLGLCLTPLPREGEGQG